MALRVSGINSGLDTESLVTELVSAYSLKEEKYEKQLTKNEWKQEAWESLNTDIYSLYTSVSNLRFSSAYSLKTATSSDTSKATVSASSSAINTSQELYVNQTAQTSYITGGKLKTTATTDTKLSALGYKSGTGTIKVQAADGTTQEIKVTNDTTVNDFLTSLKGCGLTASFDTNTNRFFVSASKAGADNDFTLLGSDDAGQSALATFGLNTALYTTASDGTKSFEEGSYYANMYKYYKAATEETTTNNEDGTTTTVAAKTALENTTDYINSLVAQFDAYKSAYDTANSNSSLQKAALTNAQNELTSLQDSYDNFDQDTYDAAVTAVTEFNSKFNLTDDQLSALTSASFTANEDGTYTYSAEVTTGEGDDAVTETVTQTFDSEDALNEFLDQISTYELGDQDAIQAKITAKQADIDTIQTSIDNYAAAMEEAKQNMADHELASILVDDDGNLYDSERRAREVNNFINSVMDVGDIINNDDYGTGSAVQVHGVDSEIVLNGVTYTSNTNSYTINGLTITVNGTTDKNSPIRLTTATDTQGIYDKIKDFLTQYNEVINEITEKYNADSASDYEPLTDDEKDAMSDTEIEKWESKIKSALLRKDTTLSSVMTAMMNAMSTSYEVNGKKYSFSNFGIHTLGYLNAAENEQNAYHIDGDDDDENTSGNTDKLMEAINNDPETLIEYMKSLASGLYTAIDGKMKSTTLSSAYKVYNDKELDDEHDDIEDLIDKWEDKVSDKEDYYYDKFTQMETALGKLNSQQSSFSSMLGS